MFNYACSIIFRIFPGLNQSLPSDSVSDFLKTFPSRNLKKAAKITSKFPQCLPHSDDFQHALICAFLLAGGEVLPLVGMTYLGGFNSPKMTKYMKTSKSHCC